MALALAWPCTPLGTCSTRSSRSFPWRAAQQALGTRIPAALYARRPRRTDASLLAAAELPSSGRMPCPSRPGPSLGTHPVAKVGARDDAHKGGVALLPGVCHLHRAQLEHLRALGRQRQRRGTLCFLWQAAALFPMRLHPPSPCPPLPLRVRPPCALQLGLQPRGPQEISTASGRDATLRRAAPWKAASGRLPSRAPESRSAHFQAAGPPPERASPWLRRASVARWRRRLARHSRVHGSGRWPGGQRAGAAAGAPPHQPLAIRQ